LASCTLWQRRGGGGLNLLPYRPCWISSARHLFYKSLAIADREFNSEYSTLKFKNIRCGIQKIFELAFC
jgi:hypothetical protein